MNPLLKILFVLTMILFLQAGTGYTDTLLLRNGDKLIGEIQDEYFVVRGSYHQIVVKKAFCKNITMVPNQMFIGALKTINNDFFTGTILNREIQILLTDKTREIVNINDLNSLLFDIFGPSRQVLTTIFTMGNGDRFSGKLLDPEVKIQTEYNQILSEKRARAVKKYLVEKGIEAERISAVGYGSPQNTASNKTAAGRALNRRIDFHLMN